MGALAGTRAVVPLWRAHPEGLRHPVRAIAIAEYIAIRALFETANGLGCPCYHSNSTRVDHDPEDRLRHHRHR